MRSLVYRPTGRFLSANMAGLPETELVRLGALKKEETVRNNEIFAPEFLGHTNGRSVFVNGDRNNGLDIRQNAVGDSVETATGYQIVIDTLTYIKKQVTEQKFYEVAPGDFIPVVVGDGAFSQNILTNRTFSVSDDFEAGVINSGSADARLSMADMAVDGVNMKVRNWAKAIAYTIFDVEMALRANSWDPIMQKHKARKKNWDLGIQQIAFLGSKTDTAVPGLLTATGINTNTSVITKLISTMTAAELQAFVSTLIGTYFTNTNSTAMPDTFVVPYQDFLGLQVLTPGTVGTYPVPLIKYLEDAFKGATRNSSFKILPLAYCDAAVNNSLRGINKNIYMLYRQDSETLRMDIPVDYTTTQANTLNNFTFQDVSYAQYTGLGIYRNLEVLKFQF